MNKKLTLSSSSPVPPGAKLRACEQDLYERFRRFYRFPRNCADIQQEGLRPRDTNIKRIGGNER